MLLRLHHANHRPRPPSRGTVSRELSPWAHQEGLPTSGRNAGVSLRRPFFEEGLQRPPCRLLETQMNGGDL